MLDTLCDILLLLLSMVVVPVVGLVACIRYATREAWLLGIGIMSFIVGVHAMLHLPPFREV